MIQDDILKIWPLSIQMSLCKVVSIKNEWKEHSYSHWPCQTLTVTDIVSHCISHDLSIHEKKNIETSNYKYSDIWIKLGPIISNYRISSGAGTPVGLWSVTLRTSPLQAFRRSWWSPNICSQVVLDLHNHAQVVKPGPGLEQPQAGPESMRLQYDFEKVRNVWFLNQKTLTNFFKQSSFGHISGPWQSFSPILKVESMP